MERQLISTINSIDIYAVKDENANFFVPVKPICEAIGIDHSAQVQRIKRHYILDSTVVTLTTVGADGKDREMLCLPLEFVYGWLFTIDANLVSESNRENVARYQRECTTSSTVILPAKPNGPRNRRRPRPNSSNVKMTCSKASRSLNPKSARLTPISNASHQPAPILTHNLTFHAESVKHKPGHPL